MSEHIFDNDGMVEFDHYVPSAKPDPQVPSLNDFKSFCESTGRHWEEYSGRQISAIVVNCHNH